MNPYRQIIALLRRAFSRDGAGDRNPEPYGLSTRLFSLKNLLGLGFIVTMIPVFIALNYAGSALRETAALGENALHRTAEQMQAMRYALPQVNDIERKARLFVLLSDPSLRQPYERESYENARKGFRQTLGELLQQPALDSKLSLAINELLEKERLIHEQIVDSGPEDRPTLPAEEAFLGLRDAADGLWQEVMGRVDHQAESLHRQTQALERDMLLRAGGLIGLSMGFFLIFLMVLNRSIRQLDSCIRRLGAGQFSQPIAVKGPRDLRLLGDRLEWLRSRLVTLEEARQQFMHRIAGEIVAPLAAIQETTEALDRQMAEAEATSARAACGKLQEQAGRLRTVSDGLMRYSRSHEDSFPDEREDTDLKVLVDAVIADYGTRIQSKALRLKLLTHSVRFRGVAGPLRESFGQVVGNAVKFSPQGGEIRVMLRGTADTVEFEVEDDGPGIEPDERERVLEPFFRGRAALAQNAEGAGLGLAIASEYLAHCQGRIEIVEPRQDHHGARIRIRFPLLESN